jgi:DNA-binding NarL/FixJ family response regulator
VTVRVALADDQALVRAGFRALLSHTEGIDVVGESCDGRGAVALARRMRPDVMLMASGCPTWTASRPPG